ncbi:MAG: hypothetical protein PHE55_13350 [Methylococcaceae bacterium]|nr:hypothetical protein [Methylococcaceae bacterium]
MKRYTLVDQLYIHPTPGGCYHATSTPTHSPAKHLIRTLLKRDTTPLLNLEGLKEWTELADDAQAMSMLQRLQEVGWVQGFSSPLHCIDKPLEIALPELLGSLGNQNKVLLADSQGFYLASSGFPHEVAEELSALSADLANMHERRSGLLLNNMGFNSSAWALVDASGNSKLGFWPIYVGNLRFVLAISGMPHLNHPNFVNLIWMLTLRYT